MSLDDLRRACVDGFPLSATRPRIMEGFEKVIHELRLERVEGEVWVNGSFVTVKIDPADVDFVLKCSGAFYDNGTLGQRQAVNRLISDLNQTYLCDSYVFFWWPDGHANHWLGEYMHSYWMKQFGFSRGNEMKGIAVIALTGGDQ